jgi:DNA-directed RNA polymerase specialized sigma subunit
LNIEENNIDRFEWENLIDRWVFDEKDRIILKRKFLDNVSLEKIAEEIDMSVVQTNRRFTKAKKQLFKHI